LVAKSQISTSAMTYLGVTFPIAYGLKIHLGQGTKACLSRIKGPTHFYAHFAITHLGVTFPIACMD